MRFNIIHAAESVDLSTYLVDNRDVIIILEKNNYKLTLKETYYSQTILIVGVINGNYLPTLTLSQYINWRCPSSIHFYNLTLQPEPVQSIIQTSSVLYFEGVDIKRPSNNTYDSFILTTTDAATLLFRYCHLPPPITYSNYIRRLLRIDVATPNIIFDCKYCTYPTIPPQFSGTSLSITSLASIYTNFYSTASIVNDTNPSYNTFISDVSETPLVSIQTNITDSGTINNITDQTEFTYCIFKPDDYVILDAGSVVGLGEIEVHRTENLPIDYEIRVSDDLTRWFKVISATLSSTTQIHDLYGYESRYIAFKLVRVVGAPTISITTIKITRTVSNFSTTESVPGFGINSAIKFYDDFLKTPLQIRGSIADNEVLLDDNQLFLYSVSEGVLVDQTVSIGGDFVFNIPLEFEGEQMEIIGRHSNKKIQISQIFAPTRNCEDGYLFQCMNETLCEANGGIWVANLCMPKEPCEAPYYNCDTKETCNSIGGIWWDSIMDCWSPQSNKIVHGELKKITPDTAFSIGGYSINRSTIIPSNYDEYNDNFNGSDGSVLNTAKWENSRFFTGSSANASVYSVIINGNKLQLQLQTTVATATSYGFESAFIEVGNHLHIEIEYSDLTLPVSNTFVLFIGLQTFNRDKSNNNGLKGILIDKSYIKATNTSDTGIVESTTGSVSSGTYGILRLLITRESIIINAKVGTNAWVTVSAYHHNYSTDTLYDLARIRIELKNTAVGNSSVKLSNFKILSGKFYPKNIIGVSSNVFDKNLCLNSMGFWDNELKTCCTRQPYTIDFSSFDPNIPLNTQDAKLTITESLAINIVDGQLELSTLHQGNTNLLNYSGGLLKIERFEAPTIYEPLEIIVPFDIISNSAATASSTYYLSLISTKLNFNTTSGYYWWSITVELRWYSYINVWKYAYTTGDLNSQTFTETASIPYQSSCKIKYYRESYKSPLNLYYWNGTTWILLYSKPIFSTMGSYTTCSMTFSISQNDIIPIGNSPAYVKSYKIKIPGLTIDHYYCGCGACGTHPVSNCISQSDCEAIGYWLGRSGVYDANSYPLQLCSSIEPNCVDKPTDCLSESDCVVAGHFWYNNICNSGPLLSCSNTASLCTTQINCETNNFYWYDNKCNLHMKLPCELRPDSCFHRLSCEEAGWKWSQNSCVSAITCAPISFKTCYDQAACDALVGGYFWYNNKCNYGNQPTERALSTVALQPIFYVNFSASDPLIDLISYNSSLLKNGTPSLERSTLVQLVGINYCYKLNVNKLTTAEFFTTPTHLELVDDFTIEVVLKSATLDKNSFNIDPIGLLGDTLNRCHLGVSSDMLLLHINSSIYEFGLPIRQIVDQWYQVVLKRLGSTMTVFINGQPGQSLICSDPLYFDLIGVSKLGLFNGYLDELSFFDFSLDNQTIIHRSKYVLPSY